VNDDRSIRRLAIVNRGEAAVRCIRAVKSLRAQEDCELEAIALYTEPDRDAPFVHYADRSIALSAEAGAVAAYLDHDGLIRALREVRADAVWPGWGFVSESPEFVDRLSAEGIVFLGPPAAAMRSLGDKITSKELAEAAGVPVTAWSGCALDDEDDALIHARRIGFPVVVKASAGGGGRGIRMVDREEDLAEAFRSASSEAKSAFGDGRLFVEKRVESGRHIEVQIAADEHGNVLPLGCRDCSVQRRHQKVLEEAPPPDLAPELRHAIEEAAVRIASHVSYVGVGTVEFLLTGEEFYFLEVNPRLQVEHGITEEITGVDLVQLQIRIARGESLKSLEFKEHGVAIEARVCAEDPDQNFLPSPGKILRFEPALGPRVRIDSGVATGSMVPPDFDSLVAKVIAVGKDRHEAIARLKCALEDLELVIAGGASNKGHILDIMSTEDYRAGPVDTGWLDRWNAGRDVAALRCGREASDSLVAAAILAYQRARAAARVNFYSDVTSFSTDRIPPGQGQQIDLSYAGESYRLMVYAVGAWRYRIHLDGRAVGAAIREEGANRARLEINERVRRILYDATDVGLRLEVDGHPYRYGWQTAGQVRSSTPAMVVGVHVETGDRVRVGDSLGLLEAMKMEIGFQAPVSGVVSEVLVRKGQQVSAGEVLLVIDLAADEGEEEEAPVRLALPAQRDPLALLFRGSDEDPLASPDLEGAARAEPRARRDAIAAVREEIRRVLLGYDANPARLESIADFLEAPLPEKLPAAFLTELAELRHEAVTFVDTEELFITAPRASVSGELGPSNNARFRMYVRRLLASGAGIAEEFLDLVRTALSHYGVADLEPTDDLKRAVLRLLSAQLAPEPRMQLVLGVIRRVASLSEAGIDLEEDRNFARALNQVTRMRGRLSDTLADSAIEAHYVVFEKREVERQAELSSKELEAWLDEAEVMPIAPSANVLLEVAAAAKRVFDRVGRWIKEPDPSRRDIALAALVQRVYAPVIPRGHRSVKADGTWIHCVEYGDLGLVVAAAASAQDLKEVAGRMCFAARLLGSRAGAPRLYALELLVPDAGESEQLAAEVERFLPPILAQSGLTCRLTLAMLCEEGRHAYKTFRPAPGTGAEPLVELDHSCYDLHPETAERIDLQRFSEFDLEPIPSEEGIYSFYGRSRDGSGDERVFVLADARDRSPNSGPEVGEHIAAFMRVFHRATRSLRTILQTRDPRRRLQWNRICLFVAPPVYLDSRTASDLARKLAPATRHLGLEKVVVRVSLLDREAPEASARPIEIVITDTGPQMEISWREPHREPLLPAKDYERKVVAARRRRRVYPYEIIGMLTSEDRTLTESGSGKASLPSGSFEEYDLDPEGPACAAVQVKRAPGQNVASVVFGVISTPTEKVPSGMRRVLVLSDPTMGMGALAVPECDRIIAAIDLAEKLSVPLEWVPVSSGAKIAMDSGTENLDATARVVRRIVTFTQAGGEINLIVQGTNVGAQSYFDALATMLMHTRGVLIMTPRASMVLTGRAALEASGAVAAEDEEAIGGFERIMGPNGQAQYYARNLAEAYRTLFEYYRYSYVVPGEPGPRSFETTDARGRSICDYALTPEEGFDFNKVGEIFDDATNPGRKRPFAMRAVMASLIDADGGHLERWHSMFGAETAIVWDAHLGGHPITLLGIESHSIPRDGYRPFDGPEIWNGGTLFPLSSKKIARAINSASGNRPVVMLANLSGFDGSPESLRKLQLEYGAEIARAVVNFEGPLFFVVVSRYHGGAYVVFSQELNDSLSASALEGSYASVIGGGPAAKVVFAREVRARALADPRVAEKQRAVRWRPSAEARESLDAVLADVTLEKQAELAEEFDGIHSVERAMKVGSLDRIIPPDSMREDLIEGLHALLADRGI